MAIPTAAALKVSTAASSRSTRWRTRALSRRRYAGADERAAGEPGVVDREPRDLGERVLDAAEAEAERPAGVLGEPGEPHDGRRDHDHAQRGGCADHGIGDDPGDSRL